MFKKILIEKNELKKFIDIADATPNEVCGLCFGQWFADSIADTVSFERLEMIQNISKEIGQWDFKMSPIQAMQALKTSKYMNKDATEYYIGIIHSHPSGKPIPSMIDLQNAKDDVVWIIYSPLYRKTRAWTYDKQNHEFYECRICWMESESK